MYDAYSTNYATGGYTNGQKKQYPPDVLDALRPSADAIIDVVNADKNKPLYGNVQHDYGYNVKKARCVHRMAMSDNQYSGYVTLKRYVRQTKDGLVCDLCGAKIRSEFNDDMIKDIEKALEVIDALVTFGPDLGLVNYDPMDPKGFIDKLIDTKEFFNTKMKKVLPAFITAVKNDTASEENERKLADMYLNNADGAGYSSESAFTQRI